MSIKSYYQGLIIIVMLAYVLDALYFGFSTETNEIIEILKETIFIEIIPFSIIYYYGYKVIIKDLKKWFFIPAFITMLVLDIIFSINIIQELFFSLTYKNNEYINFILIPFIELFYFTKINMYMVEYLHIGIYAAMIITIVSISKLKKEPEQEMIDTNTIEIKIKKKKSIKDKVVFQGILLGFTPLAAQIITNMIY